MLPLRVRRGPLGSVDAALARWLSVEWSARLLAYPMRPSGVSRYVIVRVFVLFRHAPFLADRRLRGCVINHYAVERPLVKGLTNFQLGGFPPGGQAGSPGGQGRDGAIAGAPRAPGSAPRVAGSPGAPGNDGGSGAVTPPSPSSPAEATSRVSGALRARSAGTIGYESGRVLSHISGEV